MNKAENSISIGCPATKIVNFLKEHSDQGHLLSNTSQQFFFNIISLLLMGNSPLLNLPLTQSPQDISRLFLVLSIHRQQLATTIYDWENRFLTETTVGNRGIKIHSGKLTITDNNRRGISDLDIFDLGIPIPVERLGKRIYISQHQL